MENSDESSNDSACSDGSEIQENTKAKAKNQPKSYQEKRRRLFKKLEENYKKDGEMHFVITFGPNKKEPFKKHLDGKFEELLTKPFMELVKWVSAQEKLPKGKRRNDDISGIIESYLVSSMQPGKAINGESEKKRKKDNTEKITPKKISPDDASSTVIKRPISDYIRKEFEPFNMIEIEKVLLAEKERREKDAQKRKEKKAKKTPVEKAKRAKKPPVEKAMRADPNDLNAKFGGSLMDNSSTVINEKAYSNNGVNRFTRNDRTNEADYYDHDD